MSTKSDEDDNESGIELEEMPSRGKSKAPSLRGELQYPSAPKVSCFCLGQDTIPRKQCLKIVQNPWFDRLTMLVIVLNSVLMAMYQPCEDDTCYTTRCYILQWLDYLIFAYFALEMVLKMIAFGIFGPKAYLSDPWNRLDCFIVLSGAVTFVIEAEFGSEIDLTAFRTIRVLRPLRAVNRVASLRVVVTLLLDTMPMVINVLALFILFFFIFGFIAVQLWAGTLRYRCSVPDADLKSHMLSLGHDSIYEDPFRDEYLCSSSDQSGLHDTCEYTAPSYSGDLVCSESLVSWDNETIMYPPLGSDLCVNWNQYYNSCMDVSQNPYNGAISFDNFGKAFITIFVVISMEGWSDIMYYVQDAASFWSWIYFFVVIVFGSFFMLNLFLVVFSVQFAETRSKVEESMKKESSQDAKNKMSTSRRFSGSMKRVMSSHSTNLQAFDEECMEAMSIYSALVEFAFSLPHLMRIGLENCPIAKCKIAPRIRPCPPTPAPIHRGRVSIGVQTEKNDWFKQFRMRVRNLVESSYFRWFIMIAILLNTITLAVEYHNQPDEMTTVLDYFNVAFTIFFALEMAVKIFGLGLHDYAIDPFNMFDAVIVIVSIVDVCQDGGSGLSVLRTLRLLRIVKLIRFMPALRHQIGCMVAVLDEVAVFFMVMILFVLIFSLMGMQLFGRKLCFTDDDVACSCDELVLNATMCDCSRMNFDTFANASLTVFQILTTEDWNEVLFNSMNSVGDWSFLYFLFLITIGNYILLNLLVAILVDGVQKQSVAETEEAKLKRLCKRLESLTDQKIAIVDTKHAPIFTSAPDESTTDRKESLKLWTALMNAPGNPVQKFRESQSSSSQPPMEEALAYQSLMTKYKLRAIRKAAGKSEPSKFTSCRMKFKLWIQQIYHESCFYKIRDYSLWIFSPENPIRKLCIEIVQTKWFDNAVLAIIFLNCVFMAIERDHSPSIVHNSVEDKVLTYSGYFFTACFTVELILKIIASGLIFGEGTFLRSSWNILDAILVTSSILYLLITNLSEASVPSVLGVLRVLRVLRALRPLRVINRAPGLKLTLESLMSSFKYIGNVLLICAVFYIIFAILGVQLYKGTMYYCDGPDTSGVVNRTDCEESNKTEWVNAKYNYDDMGEALKTLFVMSTIDGWVSLMHQTIDAVDVDIEPVKNYNQWAIVFCVIFLVVINFLILNMFVCVLVENYQKTHSQMKAEKKLKKEMEGKKKKKSLREKVDHINDAGKCRAGLLWFVRHRYFNNAVLVVVVAHAIALSTIYYHMSPLHMTILDYCTYAFAGFYVLETTINMLAYTPCGYVKSGWRVTNLLLILSLVVGITAYNVLDTSTGFAYHLMTLLRVAQATFLFLKLLKTATGLRSLVDTVLRTLPQVGPLGLLFFLLFFIYSALGVELFGLSGCNVDHPCDGLGEHATFENFGMAFLTLFRIATGDNWNGIMKDALRTDCDSSSDCSEFCCVNSVLATLYFVSFVVAAQFILLNIVVAMLLKGFEESTEEEREERLEEQKREELSRYRIEEAVQEEEEEEQEEQEEKGEAEDEEDYSNVEIRLPNGEVIIESEML